MRLVVLDRDGVINEESDAYIKSPQEWHLIAGSGTAIAKLNRAGFIVVVVTNQSGIGRGLYSCQTLDAIHEKMARVLAQYGAHIDHIYLCPHHPEENCHCRKPKPGLLEQVYRDYTPIWAQSWFVGDKLSDREAARCVGCQFILVRSGKGAKLLQCQPQLGNEVMVCDNLFQSVDVILSTYGEEK